MILFQIFFMTPFVISTVTILSFGLYLFKQSKQNWFIICTSLFWCLKFYGSLSIVSRQINQLCGCVACAVAQGSLFIRASHLVYCSTVAILKFIIISEEVPHFHFAVGPPNYIAFLSIFCFSKVPCLCACLYLILCCKLYLKYINRQKF